MLRILQSFAIYSYPPRLTVECKTKQNICKATADWLGRPHKHKPQKEETPLCCVTQSTDSLTVCSFCFCVGYKNFYLEYSKCRRRLSGKWYKSRAIVLTPRTVMCIKVGVSKIQVTLIITFPFLVTSCQI